MDINLLLNVILTIPLAIAANLVTPKIQSWLDRIVKTRSIKRTKFLEKEYHEVKQYYENRELFKEYLLQVIIKATLVGSIVAIIAGLLFAIPHLIRNVYEITGISLVKSGYFDIRSFIYAIGQFTSIIGAIMIVNICGKGLRIYHRVNDFETYQCRVQELINQKE